MSERVTVHELIHSSHRLSGFGGACRFVHGSSWRGTITVSSARLPRGDHGGSLDADGLRAILRRFDHCLIVGEADPLVTEPPLDPAGIVVIAGRTSGAENVAASLLRSVVAYVNELFPRRGLRYRIEVTIAETDDDVFSMIQERTI